MSVGGIHTVAFDLDDTLTDWSTGIAIAAAAVGAPGILERVRAETWVQHHGVIVDRHHWRVLHEPETFMAAELVEPFLAALDPPLFDDARPALEALRGRVMLALLTNNPFGAQVLGRHGLDTDVFDCIAIADPDLRKPDTHAFAPLLAMLALPADQIAYVGDSVIADVEGARGAGMQAVWLDRWSDAWTPPAGVRRVGSLEELPGIGGAVLTVGFDLDMTLVDSRPGIRAGMQALADETGATIDIDVVLSRLGPKLEWEIGQWFPVEQVEDMSERFRVHYWESCVGDGTTLLSGARATLDAVHARGGQVLIVTGKSEALAYRCIDAVHLEVDAVVGHVFGDEKRDALIEHTAGIYVGDTVTDVRSAIDASAIAVGVTTGPDDARALLGAGADIVLDSLDEFPAWLTTIS